MATNLALDDKLIARAVRLGRHKTKRDAVTAALEFYVRQRKLDGLDALIGQVDYDDDAPAVVRATKGRVKRRRPA